MDAFVDGPFSGNPAAVMLVDEFSPYCQAIATEMNLSETAFVKRIKGRHYHLRWFTPKMEVKICGHATLASAHILYSMGTSENDTIYFETLSGTLPVTKDDSGIILDFPLQKTGPTIDATTYANLLHLNLSDIVTMVRAEDCIIVELASEDLIKSYVPNFSDILNIDSRGIIFTSRATQYDFISRYFSPRSGINEDPVTGSAHCKLAHFWSVKLGKSSFSAYQPSLRGGCVNLTIKESRVFLSGQAVTNLSGEWQGPL